jgi:hypothetical protein
MQGALRDTISPHHHNEESAVSVRLQAIHDEAILFCAHRAGFAARRERVRPRVARRARLLPPDPAEADAPLVSFALASETMQVHIKVTAPGIFQTVTKNTKPPGERRGGDVTNGTTLQPARARN